MPISLGQNQSSEYFIRVNSGKVCLSYSKVYKLTDIGLNDFRGVCS